ncbi:four helix bundle protein [Vibrio sp. SCSIO 43136]|uniref:four helix bundle protein n=1 Tax=Vibrio sp. SCSIO 43136 TaxID=2819101 RepID=UPI00207555D2|nr:four helix bundle protein [Vibrio sp. SCSIO 43136]USD65148.1 four helix bundle protein [Vibrio sp. SCSIO 43136]
MLFERLDVWQLAMELAEEVYRETECSKDFGFKDQIRRSAISIPSNIAEGIERGSDRDTIRFLYFAKGSSGELLTQAILGNRIGVLGPITSDKICGKCYRINKMLVKLIKYRSGEI